MITETWSENSIFHLTPIAHIGDTLQFTRLPEYYFEEFQVPFRIIIDDKFGIFKNIPNVEILSYFPIDHQKSVIELWKGIPFSDNNCVYRQCARFIDESRIPKNIKPTVGIDPNQFAKFDKPTLCFQTCGAVRALKGLTSFIPPDIMERIITVLSTKYDCYQIGATKDYNPSGNYSKKLIDNTILETYEFLCRSHIHIGINAGFMHLSNCIPSTKVIVYTDYPVPDPLTEERCSSELITNNWLYRDNTFIGRKELEGVICYERFLENEVK